ncbi:MAG: protein-disulfide isomerase [Geobacteraceae bacterium GWC2_58_44]|nr:MAG: protein-disulfide isomerase [Geobacteraceae bacterium GWC2_58_44]HBG08247.1 protein-disulfide isomerase [Geobacter sp.]
MSPVKLLSFLLLGALALAVPAFAMSSAEGCGGDCASCHAITLQEANGILKDIGTVKAIKPAAVRGLYEITMERDGQTGVAYLDYGKKHLMNGQIFQVASRQVAGAPAVSKRLERLDPATLKSDAALVMGNPKGKQRLFVFTDPECPFCAKLHAELKKLAALEPDLAIFIKLYPLKMHPKAYDKARVILGAKSLALLEKSFAGEKLPAPGAKDAKQPVDETMRFAESVGIDSTPTLVLPDGRIVPGFRDAAAMQALLATAR